MASKEQETNIAMKAEGASSIEERRPKPPSLTGSVSRVQVSLPRDMSVTDSMVSFRLSCSFCKLLPFFEDSRGMEYV